MTDDTVFCELMTQYWIDLRCRGSAAANEVGYYSSVNPSVAWSILWVEVQAAFALSLSILLGPSEDLVVVQESVSFVQPPVVDQV